MVRERLPLALAARASAAYIRSLQAASAEPADLIYGGTTGGLAAPAVAARRCGARYALDLEDFHSGESEASDQVLSTDWPAGSRIASLDRPRF